MTILQHQFAIGDATLLNGALSVPPGGTLAQRISVDGEPHTYPGFIVANGGTSAFDFNQLAGLIFDFFDVTPPGAEEVGQAPRTQGAAPLVQYPENKTIRFGTGASEDLVAGPKTGNNYGVADQWTLEMVFYVETTTRTNAIKFDGSVGTVGQGWLFRATNPSNTEIEFELRDGTNLLTIRCDTGIDLRGSQTGAHHYVVTLDGSGPTIDATAIEIYVDGVQQTKNVINAGPVGQFEVPLIPIESGGLNSGAPILTVFDKAITHWDQLAFYNQVLTPADVLEHYEIAVETVPRPTAIFQFTAPSALTINGAFVPGMLGRLNTGEDYQGSLQPKTKTYYSVNSGPLTEFEESITGLSIALSATETFEIVVVWQGSDTFDNGIPAYVGDACGMGASLIYDDGLADPSPTPPVTTGGFIAGGNAGRIIT